MKENSKCQEKISLRKHTTQQIGPKKRVPRQFCSEENFTTEIPARPDREPSLAKIISNDNCVSSSIRNLSRHQMSWLIYSKYRRKKGNENETNECAKMKDSDEYHFYQDGTACLHAKRMTRAKKVCDFRCSHYKRFN